MLGRIYQNFRQTKLSRSFLRNDGDVLKDPDVKEFISEHREELTDADIQKVMRNSMNLFKKNESFV